MRSSLFFSSRGNDRGSVMSITLRSGALALALVGSGALLATPVEPDVDSAAGPELPTS